MGFVDFASTINNGKAYIIAKRIIDGISSFGVDYKELGVIHGHYLFHLMDLL
jgi:hypothetical protein